MFLVPILYAQLVLINKISALELSRRSIKSALLVGFSLSSWCHSFKKKALDINPSLFNGFNSDPFLHTSTLRKRDFGNAFISLP